MRPKRKQRRVTLLLRKMRPQDPHRDGTGLRFETRRAWPATFPTAHRMTVSDGQAARSCTFLEAVRCGLRIVCLPGQLFDLLRQSLVARGDFAHLPPASASFMVSARSKISLARARQALASNRSFGSGVTRRTTVWSAPLETPRETNAILPPRARALGRSPVVGNALSHVRNSLFPWRHHRQRRSSIGRFGADKGSRSFMG
jgi:hypothetical protein